MSTTVATSRAYGAAVAENVVAALNSMGAQPQGCYGMEAGVPTLALDFLTQELDQRITFSRADGSGKATRVNSAGLIETVPVNACPMSNTFSDAGWAKLGTGTPATVVAAPAIADPFGGANAWEVDLSGAADDRIAYTGAALTAVNNSGMIVSFWAMAKTAAGTIAPAIRRPDGAIDVSTPQAITTGAWTRVSFYAAGGAGASTAFPYIGYRQGGGTCQNYYVYGCQLQTGSTATTYIPTTTAASGAPRFDYDPVTLAPRGLLIEGSRANLLTYSSDFTNGAWSSAGTNTSVTANATTAPDGTVTASKLVAAATTGQHYMSRTAPVAGLVSSTAYTTSIYAKAAERSWLALYCGSMPASGVVYYDLASGALGAQNNGATGTIQAVGGGWYRCTYTGTSNGAVTSLEVHTVTTNNSFNSTGNGVDGIYIWGASFETAAAAAAAPFPTSYIPTTTAAVTRAADVASMTGTNFSSWFNATEGTFVAGFDTVAIGVDCFALNCSDGGAAGIGFRKPASNTFTARLRSTTGFTYDIGGGTISTAGAAVKGAVSYNNASSASSAFNGGSLSTGSLISNGTFITGLDRMFVGSDGATRLNGHLRSLTYYNKRLPDNTLKALSA